jgi:hypothetical protein
MFVRLHYVRLCWTGINSALHPLSRSSLGKLASVSGVLVAEPFCLQVG